MTRLSWTAVVLSTHPQLAPHPRFSSTLLGLLMVRVEETPSFIRDKGPG